MPNRPRPIFGAYDIPVFDEVEGNVIAQAEPSVFIPNAMPPVQDKKKSQDEYLTRGRLTHASHGGTFVTRTDQIHPNDDGENRLTKVDALNNTEVVYHSDDENIAAYGGFNNRLTYSELSDTSGIISRTFYYYSPAGNVEFIGTQWDHEIRGKPGGRFSKEQCKVFCPAP